MLWYTFYSCIDNIISVSSGCILELSFKCCKHNWFQLNLIYLWFHLSLLLNFVMCVLMEFRKWFAVGLSIEISVIFLKYTNVLLSFTFCLNLCGNKPSSTQFSCNLWYKYRFMVQIKCMHLMQKFWHLEVSTVEMLIVLVLLVTYIWYV